MNPQTKDEKRVEMSLNDYVSLTEEITRLKVKLTQRETWLMKTVTSFLILTAILGLALLNLIIII